jgi:hypothetical protein
VRCLRTECSTKTLLRPRTSHEPLLMVIPKGVNCIQDQQKLFDIKLARFVEIRGGSHDRASLYGKTLTTTNLPRTSTIGQFEAYNG